MFPKPPTWITRVGVVLVWIVLTAGMAFVVARVAASADRPDVTAPLPPIAQDQRPTASLSQKTITQTVSAEARVAKNGDSWLLVAPATSSDLAYKLLDPPIGVRALIDGGPAGFTCAWVGLGQAGAGDSPASSARNLASDAGGVTMQCTIPSDVRVAAGMTGKMLLQMSKPTTAMALPVTAVVGSEGQGEVLVIGDDDSVTRKAVTLGISDVYNIEITGGLDPSDKVLQNPTQADFDRAQQAAT